MLTSPRLRVILRRVLWIGVVAAYFLVVGLTVLIAVQPHTTGVDIAQVVAAGLAAVIALGAVVALLRGARLRASESDVKQQSRILTRLIKAAQIQERQIRDETLGQLGLKFQLDEEPDFRDAVEMTSVLQTRGRVVLIGPAGSGKSVIANRVQLTLLRAVNDGHVESASPNPGMKFPIVMSLSQWEDRDMDVEDWVSSQLATQAHIDEKAATVLVMRGDVLPIFDGLDELDQDEASTRAEEVLALLGNWRRFDQRHPFLLICRDDKWLSRLSERHVQLDASLAMLLPVPHREVARIVATVHYASPGLKQLSANLSSDEDTWLAELFSRPWVLSAALTVARSGSVDLAQWADFASRRSTPPDLLDAFILIKLNALSNRRQRLKVTSAERDGGKAKRNEGELKKFARYLRRNQQEPTSIDNHQLSSRDLILHQLWPMSGTRRVLVADGLLAALVSVPGLVFLAYVLSTAAGWWGFAAFVVFLSLYGWRLVATTQTHWIKLVRFAPRLSLSPRAFAVQIFGAFIASVLPTAWWGLPMGVFVGVTAFLVIGLTVGYGQTLSSQQTVATTPASPLRRELIVSLSASGALFPLLAFGFTTIGVLPSPVWVALAAAYCLLAGFTVASAPLRRYVAMLITGASRVPSRPARFLRLAEGVGLMRTSGIAYQFRHDELRVHLGDQ